MIGIGEPRFDDKLTLDVVTSCWLWIAHKDPLGYGRYWDGSRKVLAHRHAYRATLGDIPDGLVIDHLCRVTSCVNPAHLEAVTQRENVLRGATLPAANAIATHCLRSHPFTPDNTSTLPDGQRRCLACHRDRNRASRDRNAA